jgi:hypothetical protein
MIVRQRMQYFPLGGGGIGPTAPGIATVAYAAGTRYGPKPGPGGAIGLCEGVGTGATPGALGGLPGSAVAGASPCGSVKPHLGQNRAPGGPISAQ